MNLRTSLNVAYLVLSSLVIIAVLMVFIVFRPLYEANRAKQVAYQADQQTYQQNATFLDTIDRKKAALDADVPHERALSVALPATSAFEDSTRLMQRAAQDAGVLLKSISNGALEAQRDQAAVAATGESAAALPAHVTPQTASVEISGAYGQIRTFLSDMSKSPRLADITSLTMERPDPTVDQLNAHISIQFYSYNAN